MSILSSLALLGTLFLPVMQDAPALRYLRPEKERLVLECEVTETQTDDGTVLVSRTERGKEITTFTLRKDRTGAPTSAEVVVQAATKRVAVLALDGKGQGTLRRDGTTDFLKKLPPAPVVTTAPDWTDIFQLVRRYDATKGAKQEFPGLWIHPVLMTQQLTFSIERLGEDKIMVSMDGKKTEETLTRFRITLRSGPYMVWSDARGRVVRIVPVGREGAFVVLQGYQESTRALRP